MEKRILIIEDDVYIADLEKDYLEINGYKTTVINDGKTGLETALNEDFALVILDLMLPAMDGFEVCRHLREKKDIPIIMVTAKKEEIDKIKGFGLGIDDYIVKPFNPSELVARVNAHIARYKRLTEKAAAVSDDILTIGDLTIDKTARRVFVSGKEVTFTHKEFDLLVFLATNPNVVFSKDALFDKIWGLDAIGETSTVTVHINRIREKIEDDSSSPKYIETVWGVGYRFKTA
ncbi:MAG: response regulator transcription factor [Acutalibacteraceae bacterium]|nr:response regulator transcription factor [Oscillospiraceae bacterium]